MKKVLFFSFAMFLTLAAVAQNNYTYKFNNNLREQFWLGPELKTHCTGKYFWKPLPAGISKNIYRFEKGCGLAYNDSVKNFLSAGTYTIELYFKFDTTQGYKKIIDFDSLGVDAGFYNQNGKLVLYPSFTSADSFMAPDVYSYVAITRDAGTKTMWVYHNNKVAGMHMDNADQYIYGAEKILVFFEDDTNQGTEQASGEVAMISISNVVLDSNMIKTKYTNIAKVLDIPATVSADDPIRIYPNPVADYMYVYVPVAGSYSICDITGKSFLENVLSNGENTINLVNLPSGIYLLKISVNDGAESKVYKIVKQ